MADFKNIVSKVADEKIDSVARGKIRNAENYSRRNNLVFRGVPDGPDNVDSVDVAIGLCKAARMNVSFMNIDAAHWLPSRSDSRSFIVKFCQ